MSTRGKACWCIRSEVGQRGGDRGAGGRDGVEGRPRTYPLGEWARVRRKGLAEGLADPGAKTLSIEPRSPWENSYCESFNSRLRDEFLHGEIFDSLKEVQVLAERWRVHYTTVWPHSSLGYRPPAPEAWQTEKKAGYGDGMTKLLVAPHEQSNCYKTPGKPQASTAKRRAGGIARAS